MQKQLPQCGFGEAIGIIVWRDWYPALMQGHHNVATTYDFPVRIQFLGEEWKAPADKEAEWGFWNLPEFIRCAQQLEADGVAAITTNCGLTGMIQKELSDSVNIPVFTSSLLQVPFVSRILGKNKKVGILVADGNLARRDDYKLLSSCGINDNIPHVLRWMGPGEYQDIWGTQFGGPYDPKKVEEIVVLTIKKMISENPNIGAIVLECTEMPLYAAAVREATGLLVFDSSTMVRYVYQAIVKNHYF
jgi:hypothetical protein